MVIDIAFHPLPAFPGQPVERGGPILFADC